MSSVDSMICEDPVLASICKSGCEFETVASCSLSGDSYSGDNAVRFFTTNHSLRRAEWVRSASTTHPQGLAAVAYIPPVRQYGDHPERPATWIRLREARLGLHQGISQ